MIFERCALINLALTISTKTRISKFRIPVSPVITTLLQVFGDGTSQQGVQILLLHLQYTKRESPCKKSVQTKIGTFLAWTRPWDWNDLSTGGRQGQLSPGEGKPHTKNMQVVTHSEICGGILGNLQQMISIYIYQHDLHLFVCISKVVIAIIWEIGL